MPHVSAGIGILTNRQTRNGHRTAAALLARHPGCDVETGKRLRESELEGRLFYEVVRYSS